MNRSDSVAVPPLQHPDHGGLEVVVADPAGHAPKCSNASTWPSRNASCAWVANATWNALPECDRRITNIHT